MGGEGSEGWHHGRQQGVCKGWEVRNNYLRIMRWDGLILAEGRVCGGEEEVTLPQVTPENPWAAGEIAAVVQVWERPERGPNPFHFSGIQRSLVHREATWTGHRGLAPSPMALPLTVWPGMSP